MRALERTGWQPEGTVGGQRLSQQPPPTTARIEATPPARPASSMLGAAYQVRAESLSLAVSAHYPTHPSRSPARPACPQLCLR